MCIATRPVCKQRDAPRAKACTNVQTATGTTHLTGVDVLPNITTCQGNLTLLAPQLLKNRPQKCPKWRRKKAPTTPHPKKSRLDDECIDTLANTMYLCLRPMTGDSLDPNTLKNIISRAFNFSFQTKLKLYSQTAPTLTVLDNLTLSSDNEDGEA